MTDAPNRSPLVPLARIAALVAAGDLVTKQLAVWWIGSLEGKASSAIRFGVVHNDKGAFGMTAGSYTFELSLALTLAALVLIVPAARDLSKVDERSTTALGLVAGGAIGNLVSLLLTPAGVVDFIAIQRADGAGIVLNVADVAAYTGVAMLVRTTALVVAAIRRNREAAMAVHRGKQREAVLNRLTDVEIVRAVAQEGVAAAADSAPVSTPPRPAADREINLTIIRADGGTPGRRGLAARLRDRDGGGLRTTSDSPYLRPMSHAPDLRSHP
jgi:lipoprotein signal peptidase